MLLSSRGEHVQLQMIDFCHEATGCRHQSLLRCFGDSLPSGKCSTLCDLCCPAPHAVLPAQPGAEGDTAGGGGAAAGGAQGGRKPGESGGAAKGGRRKRAGGRKRKASQNAGGQAAQGGKRWRKTKR